MTTRTDASSSAVASGRPSIIPWVAVREGETAPALSELGVLPGGRGLCYVSERHGDRDRRGVLWARCSHSVEDGQPSGRPDYRAMHPQRQYTCMEMLRCQVCCARPANRTGLGYLFIVPAGDVGPEGLEGTLTHQPPLCLEHARTSVHQCPTLSRGHVALRSRVPRLYGVNGFLYGHLHGRVVELPDSEQRVPYTDRALTPWVLASQLVRRLTRVTVVDLDTELRAARLTATSG